ncbi:MAG: hypothetical protein Q9163_006526, partial [Psora crenata]
MPSFLTLTPTMASTEGVAIQTGGNVTVKDQGNPLVFKPMTPPETPNGVDRRHEDEVKSDPLEQPNAYLDISQTTTAQEATDPADKAIAASTDGRQGTVVAEEPTGAQSPMITAISPATRLKERIEKTNDLIVCPGVYDGLSARIAMSVGFKTLYMTGAGTTASKLGMADLGIASRNDMVQNADMIANLAPFNTELIADMDTGYG